MLDADPPGGVLPAEADPVPEALESQGDSEPLAPPNPDEAGGPVSDRKPGQTVEIDVKAPAGQESRAPGVDAPQGPRGPEARALPAAKGPGALPVERRALPDLDRANRYHTQLASQARVWDGVDRMKETVRQQSEASSVSRKVSIGVVVGSSSLAVTGFVVWAFKSGTLVASWASSLPAWRMFDPLPVLDFKKASARRKGRKPSRRSSRRSRADGGQAS
jgi:hypothetical protein